MSLTAAQKQQFEEEGFLALPGLFRRDEVEPWLTRVADLVAGRRARPGGVRIQVEPALQRSGEGAADRLASLRKIEGLVENDELFRALAVDPRLMGPVTGLLGPDVKLFRDALMMKP